MSRGDHVYVRRRPHYSHHGIDCGDGTVIHYVGERGTVRRIARTSWEEFAAGDEVHVRAYKERLPVDDIVRNAESRLGSEGYHLVTNNCEHFAAWASTGSPASSQVRRWAMAAPGAVASVGVADAAGGARTPRNRPPARRRASIDVVQREQRLPTRTPESRALGERVRQVMGLCARLNALPFDDLASRRELLEEVFGGPVPDSLAILPPFHCDYGLGASFGERVFINQGCFFLDYGGITIGDRVLVGPGVTLSTAGHPVEVAERFDFITHAPIVIEDDVWIGAAATVTPGVTIGHGSVVGAGAVVARDVPPLSVVTATSHVERRRLRPTR